MDGFCFGISTLIFSLLVGFMAFSLLGVCRIDCQPIFVHLGSVVVGGILAYQVLQ